MPTAVPTEFDPEYGYSEWRSQRCEKAKFLHADNGRPMGSPSKMKYAESLVLIEQAKKLAERDMANLKKAGVDLGEAGNEALQATIEIMRKPGEIRTKLAAARQVLEWTMAKPAAKQDVTINQAEAWLDSLAEDEDDADDTEDAESA